VHFEEGDAEQLAFPDGSFDVVVSLIGAMFAPRPDQVATELLRVCRPGGRIIMANWTPTHFPGQMFKTIGKYIPPAPNVPPPPLWGNEDTVRKRLGHGLSNLTMTRRFYPSWHYPFSVPEVVEYFRQFFGPINRAFQTVTEDQQPSLRKDLEEVFSQFNRAEDGTTSLEGEYLEVIGIKK
jgi:ubiquinone/menaquinone biosynthesis C-methylase UbiE